MGELRKTTDLVESILRTTTAARDSDNELYCKVLEHYGRQQGIDFNRVSVISFFSGCKRAGIPSIETVGRCRRKLQEEYPELRGSDSVEHERRKREKDFRSYARY